MRRTLALVVAAASALRAAPALAEPLDLNLMGLGVPDARVQAVLAGGPGSAATPAQQQSASDARARFALLSSEMALALTSWTLTPPTTTGYSGFEFDLEFAYAPVHDTLVGGQGYWPTKGAPPSALLMPALHVRKALPFSIEMGGRVIYLNQSTMGAAQAELKWAILEGLDSIPDLAVRGSLTTLFGNRDWTLTATGLDALLGKKLGVGGVMSLTPYGAFRMTWVDSTTAAMQYAPTIPAPGATVDPAVVYGTVASFPRVQRHDHLFYRYAAGIRLVTYAVSLAAEVTYRPQKAFQGPAPGALGPQDLPAFTVPDAFSGAVTLGFGF